MVEDAVIPRPSCGMAQIVVNNLSGSTQCVPKGAHIGEVEAAEVLMAPGPDGPEQSPVRIIVAKQTTSETAAWRKKLLEMLQLPQLPLQDKELLQGFLADHHGAFSIEEGEHGETDLVQMDIDMAEARPKRQPPRRMPFVVCQEVARQLKSMQQNGVIQPSCSPWTSPVVMVRKKDGSHRFCVDYRGLNAVTKADTFPLPRTDLLNQLGKSKYFSSLDLESVFWQIRMAPCSQEKTAFTTPQGLF